MECLNYYTFSIRIHSLTFGFYLFIEEDENYIFSLNSFFYFSIYHSLSFGIYFEKAFLLNRFFQASHRKELFSLIASINILNEIRFEQLKRERIILQIE